MIVTVVETELTNDIVFVVIMILIIPPYIETIIAQTVLDEVLNSDDVENATVIEIDSERDKVLGLSDPIEFVSNKNNVDDVFFEGSPGGKDSPPEYFLQNERCYILQGGR